MNTNEATDPGAGDAVGDDQLMAADEAEHQEGDGLGDDDEDDDEGDELEDVEHKGKTYQVPKGLKGAFLMQADYTRKTQELAHERRALESERSQHEQASHETAHLRAGLTAIDHQLAGLQDLDWNRIWQEQPEHAQELRGQLEELVQARGAILHGLEQWDQHRTLSEQHHHARRVQDGHQVLSRQIEGWSPELATRLGDFAQTEFDVTPEELRQVVDPRLVKLLHAAYVGTANRKLNARAQRHAQAQQSRPAATVGGGAPAVKDPNRMSTDEWMRHRSQQLRKKGR
ncbi:MAG: hypothetical protein JWM33_2399 [Caulobacteraceae bacterium]|nr:hypothetical protein [Caulobacteraceae bacterium]